MGDTFYYIDPTSDQVQLNDGVTSYLRAFAGLGYSGAQLIVARTPYRDGETFRGVYTPAKRIAVGIDIMCSNQAALETWERALRSAVNPYIDRDSLGILRVIRTDGTERYIACQLVEFIEDSAQRRVATASRTLVFYAPNPFWYDPEQDSESFPLPGTGGGSFPLSFNISFASTATSGYIYPLNDGDVETWPIIKVDGPADNPCITNETTGKVMDLTLAMDASDYVTIDMENATITWWDNSTSQSINKMEAMSADSEFWPLRRGQNQIKVEAENSSGGAILLTFYNRYLGA